MIKRFLRKIFGVHSPSKEWDKAHHIEYQEKDTRCDLCEHECKKDCYLIECTTLNDTRRHIINWIGFVCPLTTKSIENVHAVWDPNRCESGVFCPKCDTWMDDYEGQPDKCPNCGIKLDGWINIRDYEKEKEKENEKRGF